MSTTRAGDSLERAIYDLFATEIEADRFFAKKTNCKLFRKKSYYSKDRGEKIIFDISIEVYLPGATDYSMLMLIECKRYTHAVPVDDAEEFFTKVQQVAAANAKAVIASTASFQSGTRAFAKSKGIGLLRYFDATNFKWELRRSPSAGARDRSRRRVPSRRRPLASGLHEHRIRPLLAIAITSHKLTMGLHRRLSSRHPAHLSTTK